MRVVHLLAPAPAGGLEHVVRSLAGEQAVYGLDVHVAPVTSSEDHPFLHGWEATQATLHPLVLHDRAYVRERRRVGDLIRSIRPDVVHTHGYRSDLVDAPVARRARVPVVTTVHGFTGGGWRNRLYETLQTRSFRQFDAVVSVSRALATRLIAHGVRPERLHTIANAWAATARQEMSREHARDSLGLTADATVIGWVGRLSHEKGPDVLLEALAQLADARVLAAVVGDGPMEAELRRYASRHGLGDRIRWSGRVPDAARLFRAFDAFVLSSRTEGTPIVLFEAMSARVPIVATSVGGVPDVVTPDCGLLVPSERADLLARSVEEVLDDRAGAAGRAACAAERLARDYAAAHWVEKYGRVYESVIGRRTHART